MSLLPFEQVPSEERSGCLSTEFTLEMFVKDSESSNECLAADSIRQDMPMALTITSLSHALVRCHCGGPI